MMRRRLFPAIVVAIILLLCACSQDDAMRGRTLSIALEGVAQPGARTILPDGYVQPTKFDVTLTAKEGNGETRTYEDLTLSAGSLTLTDVKLGTYTVSIDGKSDDGTTVMKGVGNAQLVVTPTSVSPVTVTMDVISDSGSGTIKVVFDWSAAKDNERLTSYLKSGDGLTFKMYDVATGKELGSTEAIKGSEKTSATLTATIDLGKEGKNEFDVYYKLFSGDTLITDKLRMSTVYVYAGNTSVDDEGVIYLDESDFSWGVNVRNVTSAYDENSSVVVSWKNVKSQGEQIFDHVVVSYTPTKGGETKSKTAYFDGEEASTNNTANDFHFPAESTEGHVILDNLESNVEYDVSIQAWQKDGYVSANAKMTTVTGKVAVTSITPTLETAISTTAGAEAFTLSWKLNDNASITDVTVKASKDGAFEIGEPNDSTTSGSVSVKPLKAGSYIITVTPEDNKAISTSYTVNTKLATPTGVTAADATDGIEVSWAAVADASSYIVTKYVGGAASGTTATVEDGTSWKDTEILSEKSYSYTVQAIYSGNETLNSATSQTSNVINVPKSAISVTIPDSDKDALKIEITSESGVLALYDDDDTLTFSVGEELQGYTYEWILNDLKLTEENASSVTISRAKHGEDFFVNKTGSGEQALMLKITKDSKTYSGYVSFYNVEVPETGVSINLPAGFDTYLTEGKYRVSSMVDAGTVRTVPLTATVEPVGAASVTAVRYSSSNEEIATVNPSTGVVTFKENAYGDVTITATTVGGKTDTVTFEVYNPTVASVEEFINAINSIYGAKLAEADDYFYANPAEVDLYSGWRTSVAGYYLNYDSDGFNFSRMYSALIWENSSTEPSSIAETTVSSDAIGDITIQTTGNISLSINSSDDNYFVSAIDGGDIEVLLPSNQGMAWLHYNNVSFNSGNQESRDGTFTVTFEKILGYNNEIAKGSRTVDYKENAGIDSIHAIVKPGAAS